MAKKSTTKIAAKKAPPKEPKKAADQAVPGKNLVIVESPAKAKTLEKFLGKEFHVMACAGHIRDLPQRKLGVDTENNFQPTYQVIKGKDKTIRELSAQAKKAGMIYLAPDPDREGEAIAWHLAQLLDGQKQKIQRIEFNEITKSAVQEAIQHPRAIDENRFNAQQARRILDRLVGYKMSPLLWAKVRRGLSAGRVQSVAVRIVCDREKEILAFIPVEYWSIDVLLSPQKEDFPFKAHFHSKKGAEKEDTLSNKAETDAVLNAVKGKPFTVDAVRTRDQKRNPPPPFITSTLQQEASRKLGYNTRRTMAIAQKLYEGLEIEGEGAVGLITYMRTDSTRVADSAMQEARTFIGKTYGAKYVPETPRVYKPKKQSQDAHEAIRPTSVSRTPESIAASLTSEQLKVYSLIWARFLSSQMASAEVLVTSVDILNGNNMFRASGSIIKFDGFMTLYMEGTDDAAASSEPDTRKLPHLTSGQLLDLKKITPEQHFTEPPPRYTEASLVKELEKQGIGRPSTYAPIVSTIQDRGYVLREARQLKPTSLGMIINDQLVKHFPSILDIAFTARMEDLLDQVMEGSIDWVKILHRFYGPFIHTVEAAFENMEKINTDRPSDQICDKCGKPMLIRSGRFGEFLACTGFPACKNTKSIHKKLGVICPQCGGDIAEKKTRQRRSFFGCTNYPTCTFALWQKPIPEKCPKCQSILVIVKRKDETAVKQCTRKECGFEAPLKEEEAPPAAGTAAAPSGNPA